MIESSMSASAYSSIPGSSGACSAKSDQGAGRDRVQLPDMAEAERPQERPESRWCVTGVEDPAHPAVPQDGHVVDAVRARRPPAMAVSS